MDLLADSPADVPPRRQMHQQVPRPMGPRTDLAAVNCQLRVLLWVTQARWP